MTNSNEITKYLKRWEALCRSYGRRLAPAAVALGFDAEDIAQDLLERVLEKRLADPGMSDTLARVVIWRRANTIRRIARRRPGVDQFEVTEYHHAAPDTGPEAALAEKTRAEAVEAALYGVERCLASARDRALWVLHREGHPPAEIAQATGLEAAAVAKRLYALRQIARKEIETNHAGVAHDR